MKKYLIILCLMGLLAGCGVVDEPEASISEASTQSEASTESETTTESVTITATETATISDKTEPIQAETQSSLRERVIAEYKSAIESKMDYIYAYSPNNLSIDFAFYDMNKDGIPELLIQYGTGEADYQISIYTYKDGQLKELADNLSGGHTGFAYDYVADQLVLSYGHMGHGEMSWYDLDENSKLRFLISTGYLDYNDPNGPTYADYMEQYNVAWLDLSSFFQIGDMKKTWVYRRSPDELQSEEEYEGFDYRFLEDYPFTEN